VRFVVRCQARLISQSLLITPIAFLKALHPLQLVGTGSVQKVKLLFPKDPEEQALTRKRAATP